MAFASAKVDSRTHANLQIWKYNHKPTCANTQTHMDFINIINRGWHLKGPDINNDPQKPRTTMDQVH